MYYLKTKNNFLKFTLKITALVAKQNLNGLPIQSTSCSQSRAIHFERFSSFLESAEGIVIGETPCSIRNPNPRNHR